jgi:hypothetical protein
MLYPCIRDPARSPGIHDLTPTKLYSRLHKTTGLGIMQINTSHTAHPGPLPNFDLLLSGIFALFSGKEQRRPHGLG